MIRFYKIIILFVMIQMFSSLVVKAQDCNVEPKGWLEIRVMCANSNERGKCIYNKADELQFYVMIVNKTKLNLETSPKLIQTHFIKTEFINLDNKNLTSFSFGTPTDYFLDGFLKFDLQSSLNFTQENYSKAINSITKNFNKPFNILANVTISMYVRYDGASEFVGSYKNGKFEPTLFSCTKQFHLKIQ